MGDDHCHIVLFPRRPGIEAGMCHRIDADVKPDEHDAVVNIRDDACIFSLYADFF